LSTTTELERIIRMGSQPQMQSLVGWEFKGYHVFEPTEVVGLRKFKRGFYLEDPAADPELGISGYNVKTHPNTLGEPWIERTRRGEPVHRGWFDVYPVSLSDRDNRYPNAALLHYATSPRAFALDPLRTLRAYVAQVYPDLPDLLVGKAYVAVGAARLWPTFFVLERHNEATGP
jgi:hypothetical protein